jgi:hypothetical protein
MKRYFKHSAESEQGEEGTAYLEVTGDTPTRQVEVYDDRWRCGDQEHPEFLADQPLAELGLDPGDEIAQEEFERVWEEAQARCR